MRAEPERHGEPAARVSAATLVTPQRFSHQSEEVCMLRSGCLDLRYLRIAQILAKNLKSCACFAFLLERKGESEKEREGEKEEEKDREREREREAEQEKKKKTQGKRRREGQRERERGQGRGMSTHVRCCTT